MSLRSRLQQAGCWRQREPHRTHGEFFRLHAQMQRVPVFVEELPLRRAGGNRFNVASIRRRSESSSRTLPVTVIKPLSSIQRLASR